MMRGPLFQRIFNLFGVAVFALFTWFQRNDIDPVTYYKASGLDSTLWFLFYLLIAVLFVIALFQKVPAWLLIIAAIACLVEMAICVPGVIENFTGEKPFTMTQTSMSADDPRVELSREFFGSLIALGGVAAIWWQGKRTIKP